MRRHNGSHVIPDALVHPVVAVLNKYKLNDVADDILRAHKNYRSEVDVDVLAWPVAALEEMISLTKGYKIHSVIAAAIRIQSDPKKAKVGRLDMLPGALAAYLASEVIDGWIYKELTADLYVAYVVKEINYYSASDREPAYVNMRLQANVAQFGGETETRRSRSSNNHLKELNVYFSHDDVVKRTAAEVLYAKGYLKETQELKDDYLAADTRFTEFQQLDTKQFVCYTEAFDLGDRWSASDVYKLHKPTKMVQDEGLLQRTITPHASNWFWQSYGAKDAFNTTPVHPLLLFFDLVHHRHCWVHVNNCKVYKFKTELISKIVLPDVHRDLIGVLTEDMDVFQDDVIEGKSGGTAILCYGGPGLGKAQPLTSKVLTPSGFIEMGDVKQGTCVRTPDGKNAYVLATYDQGVRKVLKFTFDDGRVVLADENHLWRVKAIDESANRKLGCTGKMVWDIKTSANLYGRYNFRKKKVHVPLLVPARGNAIKLPLDPWLLGFLLGDGFFKYKHCSFATHDAELVERVRSLLPSGYKLVARNKTRRSCDWAISMDTVDHNKRTKGVVIHEWRRILTELGLYGKGSHERFIPDIYFRGSLSQRMELIRGLLDSDGYAAKSGNVVQFYSTSKQLARGFQQLIWSIGGIAKSIVRPSSYLDRQRIAIKCRDFCLVTVRVKNPADLFSLTRKKIRLGSSTQYSNGLSLRIQSIERVADEPTRCILVNHPDHLYITDDYVVTHNTLTAEIYAEVVQRPLYKINAGQLGMDAETVEKELEIVLRRAERWGAVSLIDEADVYIRTRGNDMHHNAIVAVFLRTFEYFSGLMFLTTNRSADVDDAIVSRMIATFKYEPPDEKQSSELWAILGKQYGFQFNEKQVAALVAKYPLLPGRDIKELLKLVSKYCKKRNKAPNLEAFRVCSMFRGIN